MYEFMLKMYIHYANQKRKKTISCKSAQRIDGWDAGRCRKDSCKRNGMFEGNRGDRKQHIEDEKRLVDFLDARALVCTGETTGRAGETARSAREATGTTRWAARCAIQSLHNRVGDALELLLLLLVLLL